MAKEQNNTNTEETKEKKSTTNVQSLKKELEELKKQLAEQQKSEETQKEEPKPSEYRGRKKPKFLRDETIYVVPISKGATYHSPNENEATMHTGTSRTLVCPMDPETTKIKKVLTDEEQEALEDYMDLDLNPYRDDENNYFITRPAQITFFKENEKIESATVALDLNDPIDYVKYKILLNHYKVASNWSERFNKADYEYAIKKAESEVEEEMSVSETEDFVYDKLLKNKNNAKALENMLRIYISEYDKRKKIPKESEGNVEWLYTQIKKYTHNRTTLNHLYNVLDDTDENIYWKAAIYKGLNRGVITMDSSGYKTPEGQVLGYSVNDILTHLNTKEGNELKLRLEKTSK